jgi:hypothetical protein
MRGHLGILDENFAATPVVLNVIGDEHFFMPVFRTMLQHEYIPALEYDFPLELAEASGADGQRDVIEQIRTHTIGHFRAFST